MDWQPFSTYTIKDEYLPGRFNYVTHVISPTPEGSCLRILAGPALLEAPLQRWAFNRVMGLVYRIFSPKGVKALKERMALDLKEGVIAIPEPVLVDPEAVGRSIREALEEASSGQTGSS